MILLWTQCYEEGRLESMQSKVDDRFRDKIDVIEKEGGRFEIEDLVTGEVSLSVKYYGENVAEEVVKNGPLVVRATERLIESAYTLLVGSSKRPTLKGDTL